MNDIFARYENKVTEGIVIKQPINNEIIIQGLKNEEENPNPRMD